MTSTVERFDVAASGFRARLAGLDAAALDAPSPCEGWRALDVVEHVIGVLELVRGLVDPETRADDGPLLARFDAEAGAVHAAAADPVRSVAVVESPFGPMVLKQLVSSVVVHDLLVHTWDLARATGGDETMDHDLVVHTLASMRPFDEALRGHGFAEKVAVPEGADDQTQLLAFLGRRP